MAHNYPKWPKNDTRIYALFPQFFLTEKAVPQTFSLLECMDEEDKNMTRRRGSGLALVVEVNLASDKLREAGDRGRIIIVTILVP